MSGPEFQDLFNAMIGIGGLLIGWILNTIWNAVKALQSDDKEIARRIASIEVLVAGNYVKREDYRADMGEIKQMLTSIDHKLDSKQDKEARR